MNIERREGQAYLPDLLPLIFRINAFSTPELWRYKTISHKGGVMTGTPELPASYAPEINYYIINGQFSS